MIISNNIKILIVVTISVMCFFFSGCFSKSGYGSKSAAKLRSNFNNYMKNEDKSSPRLKKDWF
ncbi:MAG: hypothetical protein ACYTFY_02305, partial [Planctomycetota bacterium]